MDLHRSGTRGYHIVEERMDLHSRGTRGFRQPRNARVRTVAGRVGLHSRGTRGFTQFGTR